MANIRFQNALSRTPQAVPPIWFMRQAGRYHKHYQSLRAQHTFIELCKMPDVAAEVAMGPIQDFDFDVAILFSDLLFPLEAMGMGLAYEPAPKLGWSLTPERLKDLRRVDEAMPHLEFQKLAMQKTRARLPDSKSLVGFVGGPWTLFTYAVEGAHKGGLESSKKLLSLFPKFCEIIVPILKRNIQLQLEGGAEVVMVFDTAAGELSPGVYREAVIPSLNELSRMFPKKLGYYAKNAQSYHLDHPFFRDRELLAGLGFDHRWEISGALKTQNVGFVQGNFDQALLFMAPQDFENEVRRYLAPILKLSIEQRAGWVSGLGHGVLPGTPEENVRSLVRIIREVMA